MSEKFDPRAAAGRLANAVRQPVEQLKTSPAGQQLARNWPVALAFVLAVAFLGALLISDWQSP